jgi:hypothetical protein
MPENPPLILNIFTGSKIDFQAQNQKKRSILLPFFTGSNLLVKNKEK